MPSSRRGQRPLSPVVSSTGSGSPIGTQLRPSPIRVGARPCGALARASTSTSARPGFGARRRRHGDQQRLRRLRRWAFEPRASAPAAARAVLLGDPRPPGRSGAPGPAFVPMSACALLERVTCSVDSWHLLAPSGTSWAAEVSRGVAVTCQPGSARRARPGIARAERCGAPKDGGPELSEEFATFVRISSLNSLSPGTPLRDFIIIREKPLTASTSHSASHWRPAEHHEEGPAVIVCASSRICHS
jgi:hypothetical protein